MIAFLSLVLSVLVIACTDSTGPDTVPREIVVTSVDTLRSLGATVALTATVRNASHQPIPGTSALRWESSNPAVVAVNATTGLAMALANGAATITAYADTLSGSTRIIVWQRVANVSVTGLNTIGSVGSTVQLTAIARDIGGSVIQGREVVWASTNVALATIDPASGLVTARSAGSVTLRATIDGIIGNHELSVSPVAASLLFLPPTDTLRSLGATGQYAAVVRDSSGSTIIGAGVRWTSTNPAVASVDSILGRVTAVSNGSIYVRARSMGAIDSVPLIVRQRADPNRSTLSVIRPLMFVGESVRVTLEGRDALGNPLAFGGATVVFMRNGGTSIGTFDTAVDRGDGTYVSNFVGSAVGTTANVAATIDGTPISGAVPTLRVVGFTKISAYSAGLRLTCGAITTGDLYCWGEQNGGFRGTGVVNVTDPAPTLVIGGRRWTDFDIGSGSVCGIAENEKLYCWGDASEGALGIGATSGRYPAPVAVLPESSFVALDLGLALGACAITTAHTAMCWSRNNLGRVGNGADTTVTTPVAVSGANRFAGIGTSYGGSCGVTDAGTAMCWGFWAILGIGGGPYPDTCANEVPCAKIPIAVAGGITFKPIIFHGGNEACAIGTDDKTYCWGLWNLVPTELFGAPVFTSLATGDLDNCGVAQGGIAYCWGTNRNGRFGYPPNPNQIHRVPEPVPGSRLFTQLSMGQSHMCGVATDGNAWCWGSNVKGELGDRTTTPSAAPVRVKLFAP